MLVWHTQWLKRATSIRKTLAENDLDKSKLSKLAH